MKILRGLLGRSAPRTEPAPSPSADPIALFASANLLAGEGDHEGAEIRLREAIRLRPAFAAAYCNLGLSLQELGRREEALEMLSRAVELEPGNLEFAANLRVVAAHPVPLWHFSMMNDVARNRAYETAIRTIVTPGCRVLEIGTGAGLLAMMAARAGAGHVFTCETDGELARKAREIVAANGLADKVTVIAKHSGTVTIPGDMPQRADVLLGEIISTDLIGEGLLPSYEDAKARLLAPGARVIPRRACIRGRLVAVEGIEPFVKVGDVSGFDLRAFNDFAPLKVHPGEAEMTVRPLSQPFDIFEFDLESEVTFPAQSRSIDVEATHEGICAGILQWMRLDLGGGAVYENSDESLRRAGHWQQVLHPLAPFDVTRGAQVAIRAAHNRGNLLLGARPTGLKFL